MIKVEFDVYEIQNAKYPDMYITRKLKEAGIPMIGFFTLQGVKSGKITRTADPNTETIIYIWEEE
jgi:hypothetical protein